VREWLKRLRKKDCTIVIRGTVSGKIVWSEKFHPSQTNIVDSRTSRNMMLRIPKKLMFWFMVSPVAGMPAPTEH